MPPTPHELLDFLFATVARQPRALSLRQGAAVARYLNQLAHEVSPGPERQRLLLLCEVIWGRVFQFSKFKTAEKEEAIQFLETFAPTHLVTYNVAAAIQTVRTTPAPRPHVPPRVQRSPAMAIYLDRKAKAQDDLSERICAGYWALRFARVPSAREVVAIALNTHGIQTRSPKGVRSWSGYEVAERVKQYEVHLRSASGLSIDEARQQLTEKWSGRYYPIPIREQLNGEL
jgi:hypothetical protein